MSLTEKTLLKAQQMWDDGLQELGPLPTPDEFGWVKIHYQELRKLIKQRTRLSWSEGAFYMLASVDIDKKRDSNHE